MRKLLVELDGLLDTRIGVISRVDDEAAYRILRNDEYWWREHDDWETLSGQRIGNEEFKTAWAERDVTDLRASMMTNLVLPLSQITSEFHRNVEDGVVDDQIGLEINTAPYTLEIEEQDELASILREVLFSSLQVSFCFRPLDELTPAVLDELYSGMVIYNFSDWMVQHYTALPNHPIRDFNIVAPKLFVRDPSELSVAKKQEEIIGFQMLWLHLVEVNFIDVRFFSLVRPDFGDNKEDAA